LNIYKLGEVARPELIVEIIRSVVYESTSVLTAVICSWHLTDN